MERYRNLLDSFVQQSRSILRDRLTGIYLHGSAVMGCFHAEKSDIDLVVVIEEEISDRQKRRYMDMVTELNKQAPEKGIEMSIVKKEVCNPFVYPTPFELHFSIAHLKWYQTDPEDYVKRMKGTDKDLAAHFTIIYHRGRTLYGKEIREVFSEVDEAYYMDSIQNDVADAEEILINPVYMILNLCRVLAYKKERLILSKLEGGEWGLTNIPPEYKALIIGAIKEYQTGNRRTFDEADALAFARYMLLRTGAEPDERSAPCDGSGQEEGAPCSCNIFS